MNISLEKLNDVTAKLTVNVVEADYQEKVTKELKEIGRTHTFPGFRKGHVPQSQLVRRFGKGVKSDVINNEVYKAVVEYINENKLHVLGQPIPVEVKEISMEQKDYTFEYEIGLAPEINVDLAGLKLNYYDIEVSDEMVKEQDAALCQRFGAQVPGPEVVDNALVKGAIMEVNEDGTIKETEDAIQVVSGIVAPSYFADKEQTEKFLGKKVGDKVIFNPYKTCNGNVNELASMLQIDKDKAAGLTADFELAISEIIVVKPAEHNEEFFKNVFPNGEVLTEDQYFAELRKMIKAQLEPNSNMLFRQQAQDEIVKKFGNFEMPAEFLKKWLVINNKELSDENIEKEYAEIEPMFKWQLIEEKLLQDLDIKTTEEEALAYAKTLAARQFAQYGMTNLTEDIFEDYAKRMLADRKSSEQIYHDLTSNKLFNSIRVKADVETKNVSLDEFKALVEK